MSYVIWWVRDNNAELEELSVKFPSLNNALDFGSALLRAGATKILVLDPNGNHVATQDDVGKYAIEHGLPVTPTS